MRIDVEMKFMMPSIFNAILNLTNRAMICVKDINYEKSKGIVRIYMLRNDLLFFKKTWLGGMQPVYSQKMVKSLLTIRQVEEMTIKIEDQLISDCNSCFTLLFGLKVNDNQIYLGSVEEMEGNILCEVIIKVKEISMELADIYDKDI